MSIAGTGAVLSAGAGGVVALHAESHMPGGEDQLSPANIGAATESHTHAPGDIGAVPVVHYEDELGLLPATTALDTIGKASVVTSTTMTSGLLRGVYVIPRVTKEWSNVTIASDATAAAATPSIVRVGIWSLSGNDLAALLASTANDTALLASTNTVYTKALQAPVTLTAGVRYFVGLLVVTSATAPTVVAAAQRVGLGSVEPSLIGWVGSQTDLPATATVSTAANGIPWIRLT